MEKYQPKTCTTCNQTTTYLLGLDRGSVDILLNLLKGISAKGVNKIHPTRELDLSGKKKWHATNLSRPRFHGLIAKVKDEKGYYCLTRKAGKFLRGEAIPQYAVISKTEGHQIGYWEADRCQITLKEILKTDEIPYWEGDERKMIDYLDPKKIETGQRSLFGLSPKQLQKELAKKEFYYD